jgi:hypothetical protein
MNAMKTILSMFGLFLSATAMAYPPAVGIVGKSRSCTECHADNGPWKDKSKTIIDILDAKTRRSLRQPDGRFLISVERGKTRKVITIIGRRAGDKQPAPKRNAWLYVDPTMIETAAAMIVRPGDAARDAELELQVMITTGKSAKGDPDKWLKANYFVRKLQLKVID